MNPQNSFGKSGKTKETDLNSGNMELPTIQRGERKLVKIREGDVFLLPSRVPHSPQRPEENSLGLVVERSRQEGVEFDGLRWYVDFETCNEVLWEKYFYCGDLGRDLVPVVKEYLNSEEYHTRRPAGHVSVDPPLKQDMETVVPEPFNFKDWLSKQQLEGASIRLFGDKEFDIRVIGGSQTVPLHCTTGEAMWYQLEGTSIIKIEGKPDQTVSQDEIVVIDVNVPFTVSLPANTFGLYLGNNPTANKK